MRNYCPIVSHFNFLSSRDWLLIFVCIYTIGVYCQQVYHYIHSGFGTLIVINMLSAVLQSIVEAPFTPLRTRVKS